MFGEYSNSTIYKMLPSSSVQSSSILLPITTPTSHDAQQQQSNIMLQQQQQQQQINLNPPQTATFTTATPLSATPNPALFNPYFTQQNFLPAAPAGLYTPQQLEQFVYYHNYGLINPNVIHPAIANVMTTNNYIQQQQQQQQQYQQLQSKIPSNTNNSIQPPIAKAKRKKKQSPSGDIPKPRKPASNPAIPKKRKELSEEEKAEKKAKQREWQKQYRKQKREQKNAENELKQAAGEGNNNSDVEMNENGTNTDSNNVSPIKSHTPSAQELTTPNSKAKSNSAKKKSNNNNNSNSNKKHSKPTPDKPKRPPPPQYYPKIRPLPAVSTDLQSLYSSFEIPFVCQFIWLFQNGPLHMKPILPEQLETAILNPYNNPIINELLTKLILRDKKLVKLLHRGQGFPYDLVNEIVTIQFEQWFQHWQYNKLHANEINEEEQEKDNKKENENNKEAENKEEEEEKEEEEPKSKNNSRRRGRSANNNSNSSNNNNNNHEEKNSKNKSRKKSHRNNHNNNNNNSSSEENSASDEELSDSDSANKETDLKSSGPYYGPDFERLWDGLNPLQGKTFHSITPKTRAEILYSICEFHLFSNEDYGKEIREYEAEDMRIRPRGIDSLGNKYFIFGNADFRVYKEESITTNDTQKNKSPAFYLICNSEKTMKEIAAEFKKGTTKKDKELAADLLSIIEEWMLENANKQEANCNRGRNKVEEKPRAEPIRRSERSMVNNLLAEAQKKAQEEELGIHAALRQSQHLDAIQQAALKYRQKLTQSIR